MADLGSFLQAFNPMDFIKGYEQSKKTFLEGEIREAQGQREKQQAELEAIGLGEYKTPQFTETRRLSDALKGKRAELGGEQVGLELDAIRDPTAREAARQALILEPQTALERGKLGLRRAKFDVETQEERLENERKRLSGETTRLPDEEEVKRLDLKTRLAQGVTDVFGQEGIALSRDIDTEIERIQKLRPDYSRDQVWDAVGKQFTDERSRAIIREKRKDEALLEVVKRSAFPGSAEFKAAAARLLPGIQFGDPLNGYIPVYEVTGKDESGNPILKRDDKNQPIPIDTIRHNKEDIEDFIYNQAGRLRPEKERRREPDQRAAPAAGANAAGGVAAAVGGKTPTDTVTPTPGTTGGGKTPAAPVTPTPDANTTAPTGKAGTPESLARVPLMIDELTKIGVRGLDKTAPLSEIAARARTFSADAVRALQGAAARGRKGQQTWTPDQFASVRDAITTADIIAKTIGAEVREADIKMKQQARAAGALPAAGPPAEGAAPEKSIGDLVYGR